MTYQAATPEYVNSLEEQLRDAKKLVEIQHQAIRVAWSGYNNLMADMTKGPLRQQMSKHSTRLHDVMNLKTNKEEPPTREWMWLPEDYWTHRNDWKTAVEKMIVVTIGDDRAYWEKQLATLNKLNELVHE